MANMHLVTGYAGEEHITAADQGAFNMALLGNGQFVMGKGNRLAAQIISNNQIRVLDGDIYMQGRYIRLNEGTYVDLAIENGTQDMVRNDLIVARYTKDSNTGVEAVNLVVIKGTAVDSSGTASDPAYTNGDIIEDHVVLNDMPLYRIPLDGLNVGNLVPLFGVLEHDFAAHAERHARGGADEIAPASIGAAVTVTFKATVTTSWTASGDYFYQDIAVSGILATDAPIVDIETGSDNFANNLYADSISAVFRISTAEGSIRVWAKEAVETAIPIQLKVVR